MDPLQQSVQSSPVPAQAQIGTVSIRPLYTSYLWYRFDGDRPGQNKWINNIYSVIVLERERQVGRWLLLLLCIYSSSSAVVITAAAASADLKGDNQ